MLDRRLRPTQPSCSGLRSFARVRLRQRHRRGAVREHPPESSTQTFAPQTRSTAEQAASTVRCAERSMDIPPCVMRAAQPMSFTPREISTHGPDTLRALPYSGGESLSNARQGEPPSVFPCTHFPRPEPNAGPFPPCTPPSLKASLRHIQWTGQRSSFAT
jgi:hypothetical protein